jgi:hypothetical protein
MTRALIAILSAAILTGCVSSRPWEHARIGCLQYANACAISAWQNGKISGVVICRQNGAQSRHAVTRIWHKGKWEYYDLSTHTPMLRWELGEIFEETIGPSRGAYDLMGDVGANQDGSK